jgi:hypothetical protein
MAVDKDRTGSIDTGELFRILEGGNYSFSEADVNQFVAAFRHEGTGGFQYAEFCIMLEGRQPFEVPPTPVVFVSTVSTPSKTQCVPNQ